MLVSLLHSSSVVASGLHLALEQPFFPGKVVLWLLFMLSLLSWAVMISKIVSLKKFREGDRLFTQRLRKSKKPLEIHEKGWSSPMSLRQEVYDLGAKEAAFQLLGTIRRRKFDQSDDSGKLSESQMASLREALSQGESKASARLDLGMPVLQASAAGAPFLGLLGMVWLMMTSFSSTETNAISNGISSGLGVMALALIAATPAIFGQIFLRSSFKTRMRELGDFRIELFRLFERTLASAWQVDAEKETVAASITAPAEAKSAPAPQRKRVKKKVYKRVRQDEPMINPIAMQARGAEG